MALPHSRSTSSSETFSCIAATPPAHAASMPPPSPSPPTTPLPGKPCRVHRRKGRYQGGQPISQEPFRTYDSSSSPTYYRHRTRRRGDTCHGADLLHHSH